MSIQDPVDVLAVGAHPDDCEIVCGGTLIKCADQGHRTSVLDLTRGERGSRGTPELREREAAAAAVVLGLAERRNTMLPDAGLINDEAARSAVVAVIRALRPALVILPNFKGRHPDHRVAAELGRDACFLAGLENFGAAVSDLGQPHRPNQIVHAVAFREDEIKPSFSVDISDQFQRKMEALRCYHSQFDDRDRSDDARGLFLAGQDMFKLVEAGARYHGARIGSAYAEPFFIHEVPAIDDIAAFAKAAAPVFSM